MAERQVILRARKLRGETEPSRDSYDCKYELILSTNFMASELTHPKNI
jgi:hypothetical protein